MTPISPSSAATADVPPRERRGRLRRVLYVLRLDGSMKFGSLEEQTLILARAFRDEGSRFVPVFQRPLAPDSAALFQAEGLPAEALDLSRLDRQALRRLRELVRTHQAEVVHWNFYNPLTNPYVWALSLTAPRVRHFYTDHNSRYSDSRPGKWLLKWPLAQRYARTFGVSQFVVDDLRRRHWPRLHRLDHFVNTERFRPDDEARRQTRQRMDVADRFVALLIANLIPHKGVDVAIRALAETPPHVVLWVGGDGDHRAALEALTDELGLRDRVRFLGMQRHVEPLMQAADCVVCPSTWLEAAGLVNIEGLACGLPVVATRCGGIPEIIEHGRTGFLFPLGDHRELARHLSLLARDPQTRRTMGEAARAAALERFSPERRVADYLGHYRTAAPS
jgi:glycosyltransferase involved in cell wall biosynthesis